jgi:hypothetical protein
MSLQTVKITLEIELDTDEIAPKPPRVWLYQFLNRLNYEHTIKGIEYGGRRRTITGREDVRNLALRRRDEI